MEYYLVQTGGQPAPNPNVPWQHTPVTITPTPTIHPPQTVQAGQTVYKTQTSITPITPTIHPAQTVQAGQAMYQTQAATVPTIQAPYSALHGQAMYQSATNQIYQFPTPQSQNQSVTQPMVTHALYHRETHQQPQPMYLTSSTLPKQPMYQSVTPVYTGTQLGYMLATSQPNCYDKPAPRSASDNADIINNDDKQEDIEKSMNKIEPVQHN